MLQTSYNQTKASYIMYHLTFQIKKKNPKMTVMSDICHLLHL